MDIWADQWTDRRCVWERIGVFTFVGMKVCVYVLEGGLGGALDVDGGWLPLPTRPRQYCDLASLHKSGCN